MEDSSIHSTERNESNRKKLTDIMNESTKGTSKLGQWIRCDSKSIVMQLFRGISSVMFYPLVRSNNSGK